VLAEILGALQRGLVEQRRTANRAEALDEKGLGHDVLWPLPRPHPDGHIDVIPPIVHRRIRGGEAEIDLGMSGVAAPQPGINQRMLKVALHDTAGGRWRYAASPCAALNSSRSKAVRTLLNGASPASVSTTRRGSRRNRGIPKYSSRLRI
jgi:hypothetical protein